jgi:hypothetical protein
MYMHAHTSTKCIFITLCDNLTLSLIFKELSVMSIFCSLPLFRHIRKVVQVTISFVISVCPLGTAWYLSVVLKTVERIQVPLNWTRIKGTFHEDQFTFFIITFWDLCRMRNVSDRSCTGKQTTHLCSIPFFQNSCHLWDNVWKCCRAGQATDDNVHGVLDS